MSLRMNLSMNLKVKFVLVYKPNYQLSYTPILEKILVLLLQIISSWIRDN